MDTQNSITQTLFCTPLSVILSTPELRSQLRRFALQSRCRAVQINLLRVLSK